MKTLTAILALVLPSAACAVDLTCTVPASAVARGVELCEELRVRLGIRTADWNNNVCATEFLRIGLREGERASSRRTAQQSVRTAVNDAIVTFDTNFPQSVTRAVCGDGTLDTEFGEQCDDGNRINGDRCDDNCQTES